MVEELDIDLPLDLQTENESGLPYALLAHARHPERIAEGEWIIVGSPNVNAVARVIEVRNGIVEVEPLHGPARKWLHLIHRPARTA
ncbi:MAG: hypothetical protein Q8P38_00760 [Candidatus Nanopelagicales bacterium]|nr:hypothetical protein [Candidatus Nanopelagicales bacterium]